MGRAHARAERVDQYLTVPKHGRADLRLVGGSAERAYAPAAEPARVRSLRPDWLPDDLLAPGEPAPAATPAPAERTAPESRRTVVVSGRPADDLQYEAWGKQKRQRRSPTAARLAGRPDRVAGWAVALGIAMAIMAVATGGGQPNAGGETAAPAPPGLAR